MNTIQNKRGPKEIFEVREKLITALRAVRDVDAEGKSMPSRFLLKRMEERDLIAFETVPSVGRGRPAHRPVLTQTGVAALATI
jgi:hypothetical protein